MTTRLLANPLANPLLIDSDQELHQCLLSTRPLIDVRAPIEYKQGSIDNSVNLPILNDEERALVGTTYKQQGQAAAVELGHRLVSGALKEERIQSWIQEIQSSGAAIYCFRGGLRSRTTQQWLRDFGKLEVPLIRGGYKRVRNYYLDILSQSRHWGEFHVISGPTGSGKTELLRELQSFKPVVDLEFLAKHRGSAFGAYDEPQPAQAHFENQVASQLVRLQSRISVEGLWIEDESRMIGQVHQPLEIFEKIRESRVTWIDDPIETRCLRILNEYVEQPLKKHSPEFVFQRLQKAIQAISKKLGSEKSNRMLRHLELCREDWVQRQELAQNRDWIQDLLLSYYDPLYLKSLDRRRVGLAFKGTYQACLDFAKNSADN